jgi:hypothetical protein
MPVHWQGITPQDLCYDILHYVIFIVVFLTLSFIIHMLFGRQAKKDPKGITPQDLYYNTISLLSYDIVIYFYHSHAVLSAGQEGPQGQGHHPRELPRPHALQGRRIPAAAGCILYFIGFIIYCCDI